MRLLKQSQTTQALLFLMIDSTDHITGKTGLTPTVALSKNGGSFASPSGSVTEVGNGWYQVAGNATDTNTLGPLALHATASGADPVDVEYMVVAFDPLAATNLGLSAIPTANPGASGGLFIAGANAATTVDITGNIDGSVGSVDGPVAVNDIAPGTIQGETFTSDALQAIAGQVESQILDDDDSQAVIQAIVNKINEANPDLSGLTLLAISQSVWEYATRTITSLPSAPTNWLTAAAVHADAVTKIQDGLALASDLPFTFPAHRAVTITVTDDDENPLASATVRITQGPNSEAKPTNGSGVATFGLDDGEYTLTVTKGGHTHEPQTITVSAASVTFTAEMTALAVATPTEVDDCVVTFVARRGGEIVEGEVFTFRCTAAPTGSGSVYINDTRTATSDESGQVSIALPRTSSWTARPESAGFFDFTVPDVATYELPNVNLEL